MMEALLFGLAWYGFKAAVGVGAASLLGAPWLGFAAVLF